MRFTISTAWNFIYLNMRTTKGKKQSPELIKKRSEARKKGSFRNCEKCNKKLWRRPSISYKNVFCSKTCYQNWQIGRRKNSGFVKNPMIGKDNPNWKGGVTPDTIKIRNSKIYKEWRLSVFKRDNWTCQDCGNRSCKNNYVYLEAHHIKPFATHKELRFDINNGVCLCRSCHHKKPKGKHVYSVI